MKFTPEQSRTQFSALGQLYQGKSVVFFDGPGGSQVPRTVLDKMVDYLGHHNANLGDTIFPVKPLSE